MKRIKQINESKKMIRNALFRLLETRELNDITMSQIAAEAQVVRMTLYRHFKDKEQILLYSFEIYLEQAIKEMSDITQPSVVDLLKFRFRILKESSDVQLIIKSGHFDRLFQTIGRNYNSHFQAFFPLLEDVYLKDFVAGGVDAITIKWFEGGMVESYEEMAVKVADYISVLFTLDINHE